MAKPLRALSSRSPEREALAAAIGRYKHADAALLRIRDAQRRAFEDRLVAERAAESARAAIAEARSNSALRLAAEFLGETQVAANFSELEKALADANTTVTVAAQTRDGLVERQRQAQYELDLARRDRAEAVRAVLQTSPELAELIERHEGAKQEVARTRLTLEAIGLLAMPGKYRWDVIAEPRGASETALAWRAAIEALASDADAPLPKLN